jgi:hypothetical protein
MSLSPPLSQLPQVRFARRKLQGAARLRLPLLYRPDEAVLRAVEVLRRH